MTSPAIDTLNLPPGTVVGFYELLSFIGKGGFGALYKARRGQRLFGLKLATRSFGQMDEEERTANENRVGREVAALNALRHPNIVRVHGYERWPDEDGYPYIVMDFVEGERLFEWRKKSRPSLSLCCKVISKVALALQAMHEVTVFHRDLKSENVLVRRDGEPVIVDFGIARPSSSHNVTQAGFVLGTVRYLSPEYVKYWTTPEFGRGVPFPWGPTTDLYAAGVMFYQLLTGQPPLQASSEKELIAAIKYAEPKAAYELNPGVPLGLSALISALLEKDPSRRIQSGRELAERLGALVTAVAEGAPAWCGPFVVPAEDGGGKASLKEAQRTVHERVAPDASPKLQGSVNAGATLAEVLQPVGEPAAAAGPNAREIPTPAMQAAREAAAPQKLPPRQPAAEQVVLNLPTGNKEPRLSTELRSGGAEPAELKDSPSKARRELVAAVAASPPGGRRRLPLVFMGLLVGVFGLGLVLLLVGSGRKAATPPKSLLSTVAAEEAALLDAGALQSSVSGGDTSPGSGIGSTRSGRYLAPVGALAPTIQAELPIAAQGDSEAGAAKPTAADGRRVSSAPHGTLTRMKTPATKEEEAINRLIATEFPDGRPVIPGPHAEGPTHEPQLRAPQGPAWLHTAERIDTTPAPSGNFGIPLGAHIRARLRSNLDSGAVSDGFVEARIERPFSVNGELRLPSRTMVYGKASATQGRFNVHFTRMVLPGGREVPIDGLAYDIDERKAGLKASRTTVNSGPKADGKATRVAKGAAQVLVGAIGQGDLGTEAAQRAAQETLTDDTPGSSGGSSAAFLDAGADFDIFVAQAF